MQEKVADTTSKKSQKKPTSRSFWRIIIKAIALLVWVVVAIIAAQLIVGTIMSAIFGEKAFDRPVLMAIYSTLSYVLALILIVFVPPQLFKNSKVKNRGENSEKASKVISRANIGLRGLPTWTDVGLAPAGFIVYFLLAAALTAIFSNFAWFDVSEAQDVGFNILLNSGERVLAFLTLVVVAPIAEELIFRGWLYGKLRVVLSRKESDIVAIIVANLLVSLLFGLVHMQWNVGVNVFAMSIVLCALREITGTIYAGILLHILKNAVAFYLLYIAGMG